MTIRLTEEEQEFLQLLANYWCAQGKISRPDRVSALRKMLRMVKPPDDISPLGRDLRAAHEKMMST